MRGLACAPTLASRLGERMMETIVATESCRGLKASPISLARKLFDNSRRMSCTVTVKVVSNFRQPNAPAGAANNTPANSTSHSFRHTASKSRIGSTGSEKPGAAGAGAAGATATAGAEGAAAGVLATVGSPARLRCTALTLKSPESLMR